MSILNDAKGALRFSDAPNQIIDTEVTDLIAAARNELRLSGVLSSKVNDDTDALVKRAIITYVKANFGFDNPDAERLNAAFESMKAHLTLSTEYTEEEA